jgi:hypothetical protein
VLWLLVGIAGGCNRTEGGSCEFWASKLGSPTDELAAVQGLAAQRCPGAAATLAAHLADSRVPVEVIRALASLDPDDTARGAVRAALSDARTAVAAADLLVAWRDTGAVSALEAALFVDGNARNRGPLLDAAVELSPGGPDGLALAAARVAAAAPAAQGVAANRSAAHLASGAAPSNASGAEVSRALAAALASPEVRADTETARALRLALARWGLVAPDLLAAALPGDDPANPVVSEALWDAGAALSAVVERAGAALRSEDIALPQRLLDVVTALPPERAVALAPLLDGAPHRRAEVAELLGAQGLEAPLWESFSAASGARRAAVVPGLALAVEGPELARWTKEIEQSASAVVREVAERPEVRAPIAVVRACGEDGACYVAELRALAPTLAATATALATASEALAAKEAETRRELDRVVEAFRVKDESGALADPEARGKEMAAVRAHRDAVQATLAPLREALAGPAEARARALRCVLALRRAPAPPDGAWEALTSTWTAAAGPDLATLRLHATAALEALATPARAESLRELARSQPDEALGVHLEAVATRFAQNP